MVHILQFMRIIVLFFLLSIGNVHSQNFFREKYDQFFPNNKHLQIERLKAERDSLTKVNDSLNESLVNATEKIGHLKKEVLNLKTELFNEQNKLKNAQGSIEKELVALKDSMKRITFPIVTCTEQTVTKKGKTDPTIINTCNWRMYQIVETGTPDYKGRYTWTTELFRKKGDTLTKITNADIFRADKIPELEKMINIRLEEDFQSLKTTDPECFNRRRTFPKFKLKDMRLAFNENSEITFEITYGLNDACFAVNTASTGFKISEIREFLVE